MVATVAFGKRDKKLSRTIMSKGEVKWIEQKGRLVAFDNKLYRINAQREVVWEYETGQEIIDFAYIKKTNLVYVTSGDNCFSIVNATSGQRLHFESRIGAYAFFYTIPYLTDQCLVTDYNGIYRENNHSLEKDGVTAWRGLNKLWHQSIAPDASIYVRGKSIFTVTRRKGRKFYTKLYFPNNTPGPCVFRDTEQTLQRTRVVAPQQPFAAELWVRPPKIIDKQW